MIFGIIKRNLGMLLGSLTAMLILALFFTQTTLGSTIINKLITTNPDLESGLVGHWTFDGPDLLENAADRSGQGNTGYLVNFTSTTTS